MKRTNRKSGDKRKAKKMKKHYIEIVRACDEAADRYMAMTGTDLLGFGYGAIITGEDGFAVPGASIGCVLTYASAYCNPDSRHYKKEGLLAAMDAALDYTARIQRPDGTFDLLISNFLSAPDTGFIMHGMARAYRIMDSCSELAGEKWVRDKLYEIIEKASIGLRDGGFHTPNHRWVEAAGLAMAYNITGDASLKDMAMRYLAEGIDIDENGEFTERSPGIYNAVNDNALIILSRELNLPELAQHAARNLEMMFTYIEPDGSVFTQNSVRVDKGEGMPGKSFYPTNYYPIYLEAAYLLKNDSFAEMADRIFESALRGGKGVPGASWLYMTEEGLKDYEPGKGSIPDEYEVFYRPSGIVRKRKGAVGMTLLANSPNFLFVQNGNLRCYARICASFFAVAQFKAGEITRTDDGYRMEFTASGRYRLPFETPPSTNAWEEMDHSARGTVKELNLEFTVDISLGDDGAVMKVSTSGCDRVPLKIEFCFTGGCRLTGESFMLDGVPGGSVIASGGDVRAELGLDSLSVGPAFAVHRYASSMRGSVPQDMNGYTVYFTGYSNIDKTIEIKTR
ncbi:MAG: hypothetical protein JXB33_02310 [Clostridia bacterium]|nr:hypothetical protein [Clostridia bacterium]